MVDGKQQLVKGFAKIVAFSNKAPMPHTVVDMSPVYKDQLASAKRGIGLREDRSVIVQDEITATDRKTEVRWGMITSADVKLSGSEATLSRGDRKLLLRVVSPVDAKLEIVDIEKPRASHDASNKGKRMIAFNVTLAPSAKEKLVVLLLPEGSDAKSSVRPLSDW